MVVNDYYCPKCQTTFEDILYESDDIMECPICGGDCEKLFNKMSFKEGFKDSYKSQHKGKK